MCHCNGFECICNNSFMKYKSVNGMNYTLYFEGGLIIGTDPRLISKSMISKIKTSEEK